MLNYLVSDNVIAFKNLLVYLFGSYLITLIKALYRSERPYWMLAKIDTIGNHCEYDFPMPSAKIYNVFFYSSYNVFMYQIKYSESINWCKVAFWSTMVFLLTFATGALLVLYGLNYIYQEVLTVIVCIIYLILAVNYDNKILNFAERLGFIIRTSRKLKF